MNNTQLTNEAIEALNAITRSPQLVETLKAFANALSKNKSPWIKREEEATMIFTNPQHPSGLWSMPGEGPKDFVDCPTETLQGRISRLWYKKNEKGAIRWYLQMDCLDGRYIITMAHNRIFCRTCLSSIVMMTQAELRGEVEIQCRAWEAQEGPAQFCAIYVGVGSENREIKPDRVDSNSFPAIARAAQAAVAEANGYEYQSSQQTNSQQVEEIVPAPDYDDIPF